MDACGSKSPMDTASSRKWWKRSPAPFARSRCTNRRSRTYSSTRRGLRWNELLASGRDTLAARPYPLLARTLARARLYRRARAVLASAWIGLGESRLLLSRGSYVDGDVLRGVLNDVAEDRKSTRLNSSH